MAGPGPVRRNYSITACGSCGGDHTVSLMQAPGQPVMFRCPETNQATDPTVDFEVELTLEDDQADLVEPAIEEVTPEQTIVVETETEEDDTEAVPV